MSYDCPVGEKPCHNGAFVRCEPRHEICAGRVNCINAGDFCNGVIRPPCMRDEFRCNDGHCIPAKERCNGRSACLDNSDELNCGSTMPTVTIILICSLLLLCLIIIIPVIVYMVKKCRQKKRSRQQNQSIHSRRPGPLPIDVSQIQNCHEFQLTQQSVGEIAPAYSPQAPSGGYTTFLGTDPPQYTEVVETVPVPAIENTPKPQDQVPGCTNKPSVYTRNSVSSLEEDKTPKFDKDKGVPSSQMLPPNSRGSQHNLNDPQVVRSEIRSSVPDPNTQNTEVVPSENSSSDKRKVVESKTSLCESNDKVRDGETLNEPTVPSRSYKKMLPLDEEVKTEAFCKDHIYENLAFVSDHATNAAAYAQIPKEGNSDLPADNYPEANDRQDIVSRHNKQSDISEDKYKIPPSLKTPNYPVEQIKKSCIETIQNENWTTASESSDSTRDDVTPNEPTLPPRKYKTNKEVITTIYSKDRIYENVAFVDDFETVRDGLIVNEGSNDHQVIVGKDNNKQFEAKPKVPPRIKDDVNLDKVGIETVGDIQEMTGGTRLVSTQRNDPFSTDRVANKGETENGNQNMPATKSRNAENATGKDSKKVKHARKKTIDILKSANSLLNIANINNSVKKEADKVERETDLSANENGFNQQSIVSPYPELFKGDYTAKSDNIKPARWSSCENITMRQINARKDHVQENVVDTADTLIEQLLGNIQTTDYKENGDKSRFEHLAYNPSKVMPSIRQTKPNVTATTPRKPHNTRPVDLPARNPHSNRSVDLPTIPISQHTMDGSWSNGIPYCSISMPMYGIHRAKSLNSVVVPMTSYHQNISEYPSVENMYRGHSVNDLHLTWATNRDASDV